MPTTVNVGSIHVDKFIEITKPSVSMNGPSDVMVRISYYKLRSDAFVNHITVQGYTEDDDGEVLRSALDSMMETAAPASN